MTFSRAKVLQESFWAQQPLLSNDNLSTVPVPTNPHQVIGEIDCCATVQEANTQLCSKDHHMPVPIILYYDEAMVHSELPPSWKQLVSYE